MKIMLQSLRIGLTLLIITVGIFVVRWKLTTHITVDYIAYWSAAKLAITGGNPYSTNAMLLKEQENGWPENSGQVGLPADYAYMMFNPPWTIFFILPLGIVDYLTSRAIFFLLCIGIILFSSFLLWRFYNGNNKHIWIVLLIIFTFPAALSEINLGNISIFSFLGIVLFLILIRQEKWFWAGTTLTLVLIKPHSFYLFLIALAVWILMEKRWMVLVGAFVGLMTSTCVVLLFIPNVIKEYLDFMSMGLTTPWLNSTIGSFLRLIFGYDLVWLIYLPMVLGLIWFAWYWHNFHDNWNWDEAMPILLIVSGATSSWAWLYDAIFVIPAIIYITWLLFNRWEYVHSQQRIGIILLFVMYLLICGLIILGRNMIFPYPHSLWWFSTFLLLIFVGMDRLSRSNERQPALNH